MLGAQGSVSMCAPACTGVYSTHTHTHTQVCPCHSLQVLQEPCLPDWSEEPRGARPAPSVPRAQDVRNKRRIARGKDMQSLAGKSKDGSGLRLPGWEARDALLNCTVSRPSVGAVGRTDVPGRNSTLNKHSSSLHAPVPRGCGHVPSEWCPGLPVPVPAAPNGELNSSTHLDHSSESPNVLNPGQKCDLVSVSQHSEQGLWGRGHSVCSRKGPEAFSSAPIPDSV